MSHLVYHLSGKNFSGRLVKLRPLLPSEIDQADATAAKVVSTTHKDLDGDSRSIMYRAKSVEEGIAMFLVAYTAPLKVEEIRKAPVLEEGTKPDAVARAWASAPLDPEKLAAVKWVEAGHQKIASQELDLDEVFTTKDIGFIARQYSRLHIASAEEVEAIEGKAIELDAG